MGNRKFRDKIKPLLDMGNCTFDSVMSDGGDRRHDGTNQSNEIGLFHFGSPPDKDLNIQITRVVQKVMLTSHKYHQRRKALTEMVHAWLDEGLGGSRVVPPTYAESFKQTQKYSDIWGSYPQEPGRVRVCQVVHEYLTAIPGDEWRGDVYQGRGNLAEADIHCRSVIESHPDAERIALLDFLTINQDRSARNWITNRGLRFYAIDNGMAWFHEYPESDDWKIGCVIDDVLIQRGPWRFISGVFTTSYAGRVLSDSLRAAIGAFDWLAFSINLDMACVALDLPRLSQDWRFLGLRRRLSWIYDQGRFPTADGYRGWLRDGSELMTPPEIVDSGGRVVWEGDEDRV
jgi:hypothetical protein